MEVSATSLSHISKFSIHPNLVYVQKIVSSYLLVFKGSGSMLFSVPLFSHLRVEVDLLVLHLKQELIETESTGIFHHHLVIIKFLLTAKHNIFLMKAILKAFC